MKVINKYNKTTDKKLKNNFFKKMYDNLSDDIIEKIMNNLKAPKKIETHIKSPFRYEFLNYSLSQMTAIRHHLNILKVINKINPLYENELDFCNICMFDNSYKYHWWVFNHKFLINKEIIEIDNMIDCVPSNKRNGEDVYRKVYEFNDKYKYKWTIEKLEKCTIDFGKYKNKLTFYDIKKYEKYYNRGYDCLYKPFKGRDENNHPLYDKTKIFKHDGEFVEEKDIVSYSKWLIKNDKLKDDQRWVYYDKEFKERDAYVRASKHLYD